MARAFVASLVAVGLVVGVIVVIDVLHGSGTGDNPTVAIVTATGSSPTRSQSAPAGHTSSVPTSRLPRTVSSPAQPPTPPPPSQVRVVVYNETYVYGLAGRAAGVLHRAGYIIAAIGDRADRIYETTVFYDPPQALAAKAMLAEHVGVVLAAPRPAYLPSTGTLIVAVTRNYAAG